jgi:hypothetical protein
MPEALIEPRDLSRRQRLVGLVWLAGVLLCAVVAQGYFATGHPSRQPHYDDAVAYRSAALRWSAALAGATIGLWWWTRRWRLPSWPGRRVWAAAAIAVLVVVSGWLRFHRLEELPPGLWIDEALNGALAWQIAVQGEPLVAVPDEDVRTGLGAGFADLAGLAFALVDPADGPFALRAVAAVIGTIGVAAAGVLAWLLFGPRCALVAAAWLTVSQYHLNYSRWGEMPILSSVVETLACLALVIALRSRGWRAWLGFLAAGGLVGAGLYTYQTFRLFSVLAAAAALLLIIRHRRRLMPYWAPMGAALLVAATVAAPMLRYALLQPEKFGERAQGTLIPGRADWREQLADSIPRSLLAFQFVGDENPRHNLPFAPLLSPVPAALAPIGLVICVARARRLTYAIVPAWWALALVPAIITLEAPHASRLLDAIVPIALMIGVAVDLICGVLHAALPGRRGVVLGAAAVVLAGVAMAVQEYRTYFVERERLPEFVDAFFPHESAPGRYLAALAPATTVYLDPPTFYSPTTHFVAWHYLFDQPADVRMLRILHDFPPQDALRRGALFLLSPPYFSLAPLLRALAPEAACEETRDGFGRTTLIACRLPPETVARLSRSRSEGTLRSPYGLRARFYFDAAAADADHETLLPFGFLEYPIEAEPFGRFGRAVFDGEIDIPTAGEYLFRLHPDQTSLEIDGRQVIAHAGDAATGGAHEGRAVLPAGRLPVRITLEPGKRGPYFLWFLWQPPHREVELVPATALHPPADAGILPSP